MREAQLVALGPCAICRRPLLDPEKVGLGLFYTLSVTRLGVDRSTIQRRYGLGLAVGDAIARALGPDHDLAKVVDGPRDVLVHEGCADRVPHLLELLGDSR